MCVGGGGGCVGACVLGGGVWVCGGCACVCVGVGVCSLVAEWYSL